MNAKRRVLHLVTWLNQGGIETWLIRYLEIANKSEQWQADVLCRGRNPGQMADHAKSLGAGVFHLPLASPTSRNAHRLAEFLTSQRYDLLHCHLNSLNALAIEAAKLANVPVVAMYHNERLYPQRSGIIATVTRPLLRLYTNRLIRYAVKNASFTAPVSRAVMAELERIHGTRIPNSDVLYLGAPATTPLPSKERSELRANTFLAKEDAKVVLHVGSFTHQKNHFGIIATFELLHQACPQAHLVLVGTGPLFQEVQSRISSSPAKDAIKVLGSRSDVEKLMQAADLFFLPSFHEGLPIVLMEAFSAGLPVVASHIPSIVEAMGGETSNLAIPTDYVGLANRLAYVLNNQDAAATLRELGYHRFRTIFCLDASTERLHEVYSQLLPKRTPQSSLKTAIEQ